MQEMRVLSLGQEDSLEEGMATYSKYSCLENPIDRGARWATVHGVTKSWTRLKQLSIHEGTHTSDKELISKIYKEFIQLNGRKINNWLKKQRGCWIYILQRHTNSQQIYKTVLNIIKYSIRFIQSCPTLCDPMDCGTPGLPVHHQPPEFTQTHVP